MGGPGSLAASFFPFHSNQVDTASEAARVFFIYIYIFFFFFGLFFTQVLKSLAALLLLL